MLPPGRCQALSPHYITEKTTVPARPARLRMYSLLRAADRDLTTSGERILGSDYGKYVQGKAAFGLQYRLPRSERK